jgi:3-phenylpropionate/cinnamic acid dioxygenase small subunit
MMPVLASNEAVQQITQALYRYCESIDNADFGAFAALFERGHWFLAPQPGSQSVRAWLDEHVMLYDGHTYTRHEITNLAITGTEDGDATTFACYLAIWQDLPEHEPRLMVHAQFSGSFQRADATWWWSTHAADLRYVGDLSGHIKGSLG